MAGEKAPYICVSPLLTWKLVASFLIGHLLRAILLIGYLPYIIHRLWWMEGIFAGRPNLFDGSVRSWCTWEMVYTAYCIKQLVDHLIPAWDVHVRHWFRCVEAFVCTFARNQFSLDHYFAGTRKWQYKALVLSTCYMCSFPFLLIARYILWPQYFGHIYGFDRLFLPLGFIPICIWTIDVVHRHSMILLRVCLSVAPSIGRALKALLRMITLISTPFLIPYLMALMVDPVNGLPGGNINERASQVKAFKLVLENLWTLRLDINSLLPHTKALVVAYSTALSVPAEMFLITLLATALSLSNGARVGFADKPGYSQPGILWVLSALPSGANKSGVHDVFVQCLDLIEADRNAQAQEEREAAEEDAGTGPTSKKPPPHWNVTFQDGTVEGLLSLLQTNPLRTLCIYDEFRTFLNAMGLYKGGGQGAGYDIATFLKLYNGSGTKKHNANKVITIPKTSMSIIGFSQIWNAFKFLTRDDYEGMGFKERFMVIFPPPELLPFKDIGKIPTLPKGMPVSQPSPPDNYIDPDKNPLRGSLLHRLLETFIEVGEAKGHRNHVWLFTDAAATVAGKEHDEANDFIWGLWKQGDEAAGASKSKERLQRMRVALGFAWIEYALELLNKGDASTRQFGVVGLDAYECAGLFCAYVQKTRDVLFEDNQPTHNSAGLAPIEQEIGYGLDPLTLDKDSKEKRALLLQAGATFTKPTEMTRARFVKLANALQAEGLATGHHEVKLKKGGWAQLVGNKASPEAPDSDDATHFVDQLATYKITLSDYLATFHQTPIEAEEVPLRDIKEEITSVGNAPPSKLAPDAGRTQPPSMSEAQPNLKKKRLNATFDPPDNRAPTFDLGIGMTQTQEPASSLQALVQSRTTLTRPEPPAPHTTITPPETGLPGPSVVGGSFSTPEKVATAATSLGQLRRPSDHGIASPKGVALCKEAAAAARAGLLTTDHGVGEPAEQDGLQQTMQHAAKLTATAEQAASLAANMQSINSPAARSAVVTATAASSVARQSLIGVVQSVEAKGTAATYNDIDIAENAALAASALAAAETVDSLPATGPSNIRTPAELMGSLTQLAQGMGMDPASILNLLKTLPSGGTSIPLDGGPITQAPSGSAPPVETLQEARQHIVDPNTQAQRLGTAMEAKDSQRRLIEGLEGATANTTTTEGNEEPTLEGNKPNKRQKRGTEGKGKPEAAEQMATRGSSAAAARPSRVVGAKDKRKV